MGIRLDWEVESSKGVERVGEDPAVIAARLHRARRIRSLVTALIGLVLIFTPLAGLRLYVSAHNSRADLEATIAAETLALRVGDRDAFLRAQQPVGLWLDYQAGVYDFYRANARQIAPTGEVVELDISANHARAVIKEVANAEHGTVTWFYQHTEAGWQHMPPGPEFFGRPMTLTSPHIDIIYMSADEELAQAVAEKINSWWETLDEIANCRLILCDHRPMDITLTISTDISTLQVWPAGRESSSDWVIASPQLGHIREDGPAIDSVLEAQLARQLTDCWVEYVGDYNVGPRPYRSDFVWFRQEVAHWLNQKITGDGPEAPLLAALEEHYGVEALYDFTDRFRKGEDPLPALVAVTGQRPEAIQVDWSLYLQHRLVNEATLLQQGYVAESVAMADIDRFRTQQVGPDFQVEANAVPSSIVVTGSSWQHGLLWADVRFSPKGRLSGYFTEMVAREPFRPVDGSLLHTRPLPEEWGEMHVEVSPHFSLLYFDIDAEAVEGLLPFMEEKYSQLINDLDVSPSGEPITISITPMTVTTFLESPVDIHVVSTYARPYASTVTEERFMRLQVGRFMVRQVMLDNIQNPLRQFHLQMGLVDWERRRLGLDQQTWDSADLEPQGGPLPQVVTDLWPENGPAYQVDNFTAARVLIELLGDEFGQPGIRRLYQTLGIADSLETWLSDALGIDSASIEEEWRMRLIRATNEP